MSKVDTEREPQGVPVARESAPSIVRADEPRLARLIGMTGLFLVVLSGSVLFLQQGALASVIGPFWRTLLMAGGVGCLLYHAARDNDTQVRRTYGALGFVLLAAAGIISALPIGGASAGSLFLPYGLLFLAVALPFFLAFLRNEEERGWRRVTLATLGAVGAGLALAGFVGGSLSPAVLVPYGVVLALLGLAYLWAFLVAVGPATDLGYRVGLGMGAVGVLAALVALGRSLPSLLHSWGWLSAAPPFYLVPDGLLLITLGAAYALLAAALISEQRVIVMTRRELAAYFYSPIAYIVLFGFAFVAWVAYLMFINEVVQAGQRGQPLIEPVFQYYLINWFPVFSMVFIVPVVTMRLLSDERRTGTLEVLLTAPVGEVAVVLSKFFAALVFFLMVCTPWAVFLISLRVMGRESFDYQPLFAFSVALVATAAGFISMGLFFSSLTRNQIIAAIPTFGLMLLWTFLYFIKQSRPPDSPTYTIMSHVSYVDFWINAVDGKLSLRYLVFHVSAAVFWLYATVKVLEARRWT
jgi:hypothetical protein